MSSAASFQASEGRDDGSADSPNSELRLGIEVPLDDVEAEELSFHMMRIRKLQNLERCTKLKVRSLNPRAHLAIVLGGATPESLCRNLGVRATL